MKNSIMLLAICMAFSNLSFSQIMFTEVQPSPFGGLFNTAIALADIDADGDQDFLLTGLNTGASHALSLLYSNTGNGNFTLLTEPFEGVENGAVAFGDIDGDGDMDLIITGVNNNFIFSSYLYSNDGNGVFTEIASPFQGVRDGAVAFSDVDGDGDQDVIISGRNGPSYLNLYLNNGAGIFTLSPNGTFLGLWGGSLAFADVDGDGDPDFLATGANDAIMAQTQLYINQGDGTFILEPNTPFLSVYLGDISFADIDGDNDQDLLISGTHIDLNEGNTRLYTNDGTGHFSEVTNTGFEQFQYSSLAFADVDGDNDPDVIISGQSSNGVITKLYANNGFGIFSDVAGLPFQGTGGPVVFQDIDGDGDPDVIIATFDEITNLYLNQTVLGVINFNESTKISFFPNPTTAIINFKGISEEATVQLYDLTGKKLMDTKIDTNSTSMDISQLSQGIYLVRINDQFSGKLVKI